MKTWWPLHIVVKIELACAIHMLIKYCSLEHSPLLRITKYFTCNTKQKTDREASQDNNEREAKEKFEETLN